MYSGVGLGLLRGDVVVSKVDGVTTLTPEAFLGLYYYPRRMSLKEPHVTLDEAALRNQMTAYCEAQNGVVGIAFQGEVSGMNGWRSISVEQACQR